jgi:hypothetical protein
MQTQLQSKVDHQHCYRVAMVSCIVLSEQSEQQASWSWGHLENMAVATLAKTLLGFQRKQLY